MSEMRIGKVQKLSAELKDLNSKKPSSSIKSTIIAGLLVVAVIFVGLGAWSATAPLARAVAAYATLTVEGERKQIQHFEGGIVASLRVTEGQLVKKDELLMSLNPLQASASVARHDAQFDQALAREARLQSELQGEKTIVFSGLMLDRLSDSEKALEFIATEERHFIARKETLDGTIIILKQRIQQLENEIKGLRIQREARLEQLNIFKSELMGLKGLYEKGYYPKSKILAVERAIVELRGAAGNDLALISRAQSSRGEAENQIVNVKRRFREDVIAQLRDVKVEVADLKERLLVAKDILKRIEVRAPRSGIVQGIQFHTIGGVVRPGEVLMEIAPQDEDLIVTAQVMPNDIDNVEVGQRAEVRLTALNTRSTPAIYGKVRSISGDSLTDKSSSSPYFLTRIELPPKEMEKLGKVKLSAGMQAEVLIQTGERTALDYLLKPMLDAFSRGLNED